MAFLLKRTGRLITFFLDKSSYPTERIAHVLLRNGRLDLTTKRTSGDEELPALISIQELNYSRLRRTIALLSGLSCIVLGIVGWVLPFVPGVPLLVFGIALCCYAIPSLAKRVNCIDERLPLSIRLWFRPKFRRQTREQQQVASFFERPE